MTDTAPELAVQSVAYAGLDALLAAVPFDLCAYLHVGDQLGPQLYLRRPTLASLDPADAFRLFSALRDQLEAAPTDELRLTVDEFEALVAPSAGRHSRGLWVAGRRGSPVSDTEAETAGVIGRAVMTVCHMAENATSARAVTAARHVAVETGPAGVRATVTVDHEGAERIGHADGPAAVAAVAGGALDAIDPSLKLVAADEDAIGGERAVLVLVNDAAGRSGLGAALVGTDPLSAAAAAALGAATSLA